LPPVSCSSICIQRCAARPLADGGDAARHHNSLSDHRATGALRRLLLKGRRRNSSCEKYCSVQVHMLQRGQPVFQRRIVTAAHLRCAVA
jgi:hypothetical protein